MPILQATSRGGELFHWQQLSNFRVAVMADKSIQLTLGQVSMKFETIIRRNFGPAKKIVRVTKISGKWSPPDSKILVRKRKKWSDKQSADGRRIAGSYV